MPAPSFAVCAAAFLVAVALAGCAEAPAAIDAEVAEELAALPPDYEKAEEGVSDGLGSIVGHVVDDEHLPLKGALVGFKEPYIADVTDKAGYFEIGQLTPGKWDLYVIHMGHKADGLRVNVQPGAPTKVTFVLPVLPVEEPWTETIPFEGRIDRSIRVAGFGSACCPDGRQGLVDLGDQATAVNAIVVGLDWQSTSMANSGLQVALDVPEARSSTFLSAGDPQGPVIAATDEASITPIQRADYERCEESGCELRWTVDAYWKSGVLDSGTAIVGSAYDQSFIGAISVFYRQTPAEGYSPLPE